MSLTNPDMTPELFLKRGGTMDQPGYGTSGNVARVQTESLGRMGFESEQWNDISGKAGGLLGFGKFGATKPGDWTPVDYKKSLHEGLGLDRPVEIKNPNIVPINAIETMEQRKMDLPGPDRGHYGSNQPQAMLLQNNENEFRSTIVSGQLLEDQNSIGIGNWQRNQLFSEANYSLV